jgi:GNAT superfamily N-acetyltransferase
MLTMTDPRRFQIRRAIPGDAHGILAAHVASIVGVCAADYTPEQLSAWVSPKTADQYVRAMSAGHLIWVATWDGEVVGFADLVDDMLEGLYLRPEIIGRGVGRALLEAAESAARDAGVRRLELYATLTSYRFYMHMGYEPLGPGEFRPGGVDVPCVHMRKSLG